MEDLNLALGNRNVISIAQSIQKIFKNIKEKTKNKNPSDDPSKDIEQLKALCKSENTQISLLAVQCFLQLAADSVLDIAQCLVIFISILPNSSLNHYTTISEGLTDLMLMELKRKCTKSNYVCKFGLRPPQHPFIVLINKDINKMSLLTNKLLNIFNHHDEVIRNNSIEFLRPVILYILCNIDSLPQSNKIWNSLLRLESTKNYQAFQMMFEVLCWSKVSTAALCQSTDEITKDSIEHYIFNENYEFLNDLCLYYAVVTKLSIQHGFDPRTNFCIILTILHSNAESAHYSILTMILADTLQNISPIYVPELLRVIKYIVLQNKINFLSLHMVMDGILQWLAQPSFITRKLEDAEFILNYIIQKKYLIGYKFSQTKELSSNLNIQYFHPDIALYSDISVAFEAIERNNFRNICTVIDRCKRKTFCQRIDLIFRGLFLCDFIDFEEWKKVFNIVMDNDKSTGSSRSNFSISLLYKLANDDEPKIKLLLLRSLCSFGAKNQILNTIKTITKELDRSFSIDMYLRLWKAEPRTYPFLYNILIEKSEITENRWEIDITRAYAIKEICSIKPQQHGADLIGILSDILNKAVDKHEEVAAYLALDAISMLCENHVVNVVSTWKAISFKFRYEKSTRIIKSLCQFFGHIPGLNSPTIDYQNLFDEVLEKLWSFVTNKNGKDIKIYALQALRNFPLENLKLKHLPEVYRLPAKPTGDEGVEGAEPDLDIEIPPESWLYMLKHIDKTVINEAGDILAHYVYNEIGEYRGGVYLIPDGKPEPDTLKYLPSKSLLRALVQFVLKMVGRKLDTESEIVVSQILRILSVKFPKPIPPLNWNFLIEYFHKNDNKLKKYCLEIATHQLPISGSAKRLVENYLENLQGDEEEVIWLYTILPDLMAGVSTLTFTTFFANSCDSAFRTTSKSDTSASLFEQILDLLKPVVLMKDCANLDNLNFILEKITTYFDKLDLDDKVFTKYIELFALLPISHIENSLAWNSMHGKVQESKLKKIIHAICKLPMYSKSLDDTLNLLNGILDDIYNADISTVQQYFEKCFIDLISTHDDEKQLNNWIQGIIVQIENLLTTSDSNNIKKCLFLLDLFIINVIIISGYHFALSDDHDSAERLRLFPQCLYLLYQQNIWRDSENKVYEFLLHLYNNNCIPSLYADGLRYALVCCKNQTYFQKPNVWSKFILMRR